MGVEAMPRPSYPAADSVLALSDDAWNRLERILERFEDAWRRGEQPALEPFLAEAEPAERAILLFELVHEDLDYRLRAGQPARVEDYLRRFPELERTPEHVVELITGEYRCCL